MPLPDWAHAKMRRDNDRRCRADILLVPALSALTKRTNAPAPERKPGARGRRRTR